jgi:hypothetical protein
MARYGASANVSGDVQSTLELSTSHVSGELALWDVEEPNPSKVISIKHGRRKLHRPERFLYLLTCSLVQTSLSAVSLAGNR